MLANFAGNILEAFTAPRRSARTMLRAGLSLEECVLMVVLGVAVHGLVAEVMALTLPDYATISNGGLGTRAAELAVQLLMFFLLSGAAQVIGERFGGKGSIAELRTVVAWHALVTSFLAPLNVAGMSAATPDGRPSGTALLVMVSVALSIWIFASFVAEAHGFRKIGGVIGATVMGFMLFGLVAMMLMGMLTGGAA